jgi:hypothetical protein
MNLLGQSMTILPTDMQLSTSPVEARQVGAVHAMNSPSQTDPSLERKWSCRRPTLEETWLATSLISAYVVFGPYCSVNDLSNNHCQIPGGGVGIFNGCTTEWGAPSSGWGAQYGGVTAASDCAALPEALQAGCEWRFGWFEGADNPTVSFEQVACPAALTANTGCVRADDSSFLAVAAVSGSAIAAVSSTASTDPTPATTQAVADPTTNNQVVVDPTTSSQVVVDPTTSTAAAVVVPTSSSTPVEQVSASFVAALVSTSSSGIITTTTSSDPTYSTEPVVTTTIYRDDVCEL